MKYVSDESGFPKQTHFAVLVFDSIFVPGDERSRTHPGHGYPEHTESVVKYIVFDSKEDLEKWVAQQETGYYRKDNYRVISATPLNVVKKFSVEVKASQ